MMKRITVADLEPSRQPLDLLDALVDLPRDELPAMKDKVLILARHGDPDVRYQALQHLCIHLRDTQFHGLAVDALKYDPSAKVRRLAAFGIAGTTSESTHATDVQTLVEKLDDTGEELSVRGAAYEALLLMHRRTDFPPIKQDIDLANDVDWAWITGLRNTAPM